MPPQIPTDDFKGVHYEHIKNVLPLWIKNASLDRVQSLKAAPRRTARPYPAAPPERHQHLKGAIADHWQNQNSLDQKLQTLSDVQAFAEPLLKGALQVHYGDIDVRTTFVRLYVKARLAWWVRDTTGGVVSITVSLLDAALHNFAATDRFVDHAFLSAEDRRGQRDVLTLRHKTSGNPLTAEQFKDICRAQDIGARYQARLRDVLGFNNQAVARALRLQVITSHKSALTVAAHLALIKGDLLPDAHTAILALLAGRQDVRFEGRALNAYNLRLMNTPLVGILVFAPPLDAKMPLGRLMAYVPEDPEHPLKEYPSPAAFMRELTRQLRDTERYQIFFSQFVDHAERGYFFANLNDRLSKVRWHQKAPTDPSPTWKDTPVDNPNLQFRLQRIEDDYQNRSSLSTENDLWSYQYRTKLNKIVNDARDIAVSTALADRRARWTWWDNLEKILSDILNAALLVVTPFVPVLGELMLAYSAYQLVDDIVEGLVDVAEGLGLEATGHVLDVVDNVLQFALFGAAGAVGQVARLKLSPFIEGLKPVTLPDGRTRLWNPDLAPYALKNIELAADAKPDAAGLHQHQGKQILALHDRLHEVREVDDGQPRIQHPERADAYHPKVMLNGQGAVAHEAEQPRTWDSHTLMRRLGPRTRAFSNAELQQVQRISATDDDRLRSVYVHGRPTPPLLEAAFARHEAYHTAGNAIETVRAGAPLPPDPSSAWFEQTVTELQGWPEDTALEVFVRPDLSGDSRRYGKPGSVPTTTLKMSLGDVMSGQLPERVLGFLDEAATRTLLGRVVPPTQRVQALRDQLADYVTSQTDDIAHYVHQINQQSDSPHIRLLRQHLPSLDSTLAQTVIDTASDTERQVMDHQHLPLRLKNRAHTLGFAEDANQAYAGFYSPWPITADTERLALNTLKLHSDAFADLHVEIRERTTDGPLRCEAGPATASRQRILVRKNSLGYEVFGPANHRVHGLDTLYESLLHAVPVPGHNPGQGAELKRWLMDKLQSLPERRRALAQPPQRTTADTETSRLLTGSCIGSQPRAPQAIDAAHTRETLRLLFPSMSEQRLEQFIESVDPSAMAEVRNALVLEKAQLQTTLEHWKRVPSNLPKNSRAFRLEKASRHFVADLLYRCWEDRMAEHTDPWGHVQAGAELDFNALALPDVLPELPGGFEHVTRLVIAHNRFGVLHETFLKSFPNLRTLDLSRNHLERLPEAIGDMRFLKSLNLSDNRIVLPAEAAQRLARLKRMEHLDLQNNPLGHAPDISKMPNLRALHLSRTQLAQWPAGLFAHPRDRSFLLDLRGNPIEQVPHLPADAPQAETIARTRLSRNTLGNDQRALYERYRVAAGLDPHRTYEPRGDSAYWLEVMDPQMNPERKATWDALEREHGSQGLFEVLKSLEADNFAQTEQDQQRMAANRTELSQRVWQLILTASADTELREKLFKLSSFPGLCADGGAQIFNEMGIEVLVTQAQRYSLSDTERAGRLVTLAKGSARLKHLGKIIQQDIAHRLKPVDEGGLGQRLRADVRDGEPGEVDEVEIYLAYQTSLANPLDLPWVSDHMLYRLTANVEQPQIDQAYTTVLGLGEGDGLVNQMLLEPYWEQYLRDSHDAEYRDNERRSTEQFFKLDELQDAQAQWVRSQDVALKQTLEGLADELQVPEGEVFNGKEMSGETYARLLNDLGYREKEWLRRLTREMLAKANGLRNRGALSTNF